jgi:hypothetical protein
MSQYIHPVTPRAQLECHILKGELDAVEQFPIDQLSEEECAIILDNLACSHLTERQFQALDIFVRQRQINHRRRATVSGIRYGIDIVGEIDIFTVIKACIRFNRIGLLLSYLDNIEDAAQDSIFTSSLRWAAKFDKLYIFRCLCHHFLTWPISPENIMMEYLMDGLIMAPSTEYWYEFDKHYHQIVQNPLFNNWQAVVAARDGHYDKLQIMLLNMNPDTRNTVFVKTLDGNYVIKPEILDLMIASLSTFKAWHVSLSLSSVEALVERGLISFQNIWYCTTDASVEVLDFLTSRFRLDYEFAIGMVQREIGGHHHDNLRLLLTKFIFGPIDWQKLFVLVVQKHDLVSLDILCQHCPFIPSLDYSKIQLCLSKARHFSFYDRLRQLATEGQVKFEGDFNLLIEAAEKLGYTISST